jgi:hypothetical protein
VVLLCLAAGSAAQLGPWAGQVAGYYADTIPCSTSGCRPIGHDASIDWNPRPGRTASAIPFIAVLNWMGIDIIESLDLERAIERPGRAKCGCHDVRAIAGRG